MADIKIFRSHSMSKDEIRKRVGAAARDIESELGAKTRWDGDVVRFEMKRKIAFFEKKVAEGRLEMSSSEVYLVIKMSRLATNFISKEQVRKEAERLLDERLQQ